MSRRRARREARSPAGRQVRRHRPHQVHEHPDVATARSRSPSGIVYGALDSVAEASAKQDPLDVFHEALENVKPALEVRSRRVGGATYQVPVEVRPERRQALAIRWLIQRRARPLEPTA